MDEKKLKALAAERSMGLKDEAELIPSSRMLAKLTIEIALSAEHEQNDPKPRTNNCNDYSLKR